MTDKKSREQLTEEDLADIMELLMEAARQAGKPIAYATLVREGQDDLIFSGATRDIPLIFEEEEECSHVFDKTGECQKCDATFYEFREAHRHDH